MLHALGAATSALDLLKSLTAAKSQSAGIKGSKSPFDLSGSAAAEGSAPAGAGSKPLVSPATMSALLAAQSQATTGSPPSASSGRPGALKDLFAQIDADMDGKLSKSEFEQALGAGGTNLVQADSVFGRLDRDDDGAVSLGEMMSALNGKGRRQHDVAGSDRAAGSGAPGGPGTDPLMQALQGASSTSVTNSDGSVTTSRTYADGSRVTTTSAAATSAFSSATSSYNVIEQMIQRRAQAISSAATASLSVSA
ncbi:EF-hand domain-containing protein [Bradyrhizobium sp.]|uniref:EF-hand domain-containing protein n=1 Tax=Bradyrhizobium sp. TaxID=376 RepID=UPI000AD8091D|nr:EF-hand domain-containing protein [Bradyrhizobium sp.]